MYKYRMWLQSKMLVLTYSTNAKGHAGEIRLSAAFDVLEITKSPLGTVHTILLLLWSRDFPSLLPLDVLGPQNPCDDYLDDMGPNVAPPPQYPNSIKNDAFP